MLVTFDHAIIEFPRFREMAKLLRDFVIDVGLRDRVCHFLSVADLLEKNIDPCIGMCFYGKSVSSNPWYLRDEEKDELILYDFEKGKDHFFIGESLDERESHEQKKSTPQ